MESIQAGIGSEALYPFLSNNSTDPSTVRQHVCDSTREKARQIQRLRKEMHAYYGAELVSTANEMARRFAAGGRLLTFGNGGSSTDAQDLASLFMHPGPGLRALPAIGLTSDIAVVTALSNDVGFDVVFARQIGAFARSSDIAIGLSTSGNSPNLVHGFEKARQLGMLTVGIAGDKGGKMAESACIDHLFVVPSDSVHRIQEAHTTLYHALWELTVGAGELPLAHTPEPLQGATDVPGHTR